MRKTIGLILIAIALAFSSCSSGTDGSDSDNGNLSWISIPSNGTTNATVLNGILSITFSKTMNGVINIEYSSTLDPFIDGESWSVDNKTLTITLGTGLDDNTVYYYTLNPTGTAQTMGSQDGELVPVNTRIIFTTDN